MYYDVNMPGCSSAIVYVVGAIIVGVTMDWAIFERVKIVLGAFGDHNEVKYRDLPQWRIILVVLASAVIGATLSTPTLHVLPFFAGTAIFAALNIYGDCIALRR